MGFLRDRKNGRHDFVTVRERVSNPKARSSSKYLRFIYIFLVFFNYFNVLILK
jgi:hypothetical protein